MAKPIAVWLRLPQLQDTQLYKLRIPATLQSIGKKEQKTHTINMSKVWLITGCSSGFGKEIALAAAKDGDTVVATARDVSKLEDLAKLGIITKRLDVLSDDDEMKSTIDDILQTVGRIDVLVNNAGYILEGAIEECRYAFDLLTPSQMPAC